MKRALLVTTCLLAACGPHDVRLEVDGVPAAAASIVVSLALGNEVAPELVYPIATNKPTLTLVLSLPERSGWITATVVAQDANQCDLAIAAGGIDNDFSAKVDDQALGLFPTITTECNLSHTPGMLSYDGGTYVLGCDPTADPDCASDQSPQRSAVLGAFELDATEVTVGAYRDCVNDHGKCPAPVQYEGFVLSDDQAQNGLTWAAAGAFCSWAGKTLPTEAQWEAAMRGPEGRLYPWGSDTPTCDYANYYDDVADEPCVPDSSHELDERRYVPGYTPLGLTDAAGNVAEWVSDFYAPRSSLDSETLVTGPMSGTQYVTKGGSFVDYPVNLRGAARYPYDPDGTGPNVTTVPAASNIGVRCAITR